MDRSEFQYKDMNNGMDRAAGDAGYAASYSEQLNSQRRRTTAAEVMYGVGALTVAIFLLVTAL